MKITDPQVIRDGEKDLIQSVKKDLDLSAVKEILTRRMAGAALTSRGGQIIVHNNDIAFRMDFDVQLSGSLMFDRQGNYIPEAGETRETLLSEDLDLDPVEDSLNTSDKTPVNRSGNLEPETRATLDETQQDGDEAEESLEMDLTDYELDDAPEQNAQSDLEIETSDIIQDDLVDEDLVDEDMNDILKESREFWELKKDS